MNFALGLFGKGLAWLGKAVEVGSGKACNGMSGYGSIVTECLGMAGLVLAVEACKVMLMRGRFSKGRHNRFGLAAMVQLGADRLGWGVVEKPGLAATACSVWFRPGLAWHVSEGQLWRGRFRWATDRHG